MVGTKELPYDTDVRVPFFARGPGLPANVTRGRADRLRRARRPRADLLRHRRRRPGRARGRRAARRPSTARRCCRCCAARRRPRRRAATSSSSTRATTATGARSTAASSSARGRTAACTGGTRSRARPRSTGRANESSQWCSCNDSGNNSYACVRTVAADADRLFCRTYSAPGAPYMATHYEEYDLADDPWQLENRVAQLDGALVALLEARAGRRAATRGGRAVRVEQRLASDRARVLRDGGAARLGKRPPPRRVGRGRPQDPRSRPAPARARITPRVVRPRRTRR